MGSNNYLVNCIITFATLFGLLIGVSLIEILILRTIDFNAL